MHLVNDPSVWLKDIFAHAGLDLAVASILSSGTLVVVVIILSWLSNLIAKAVILKIVTRIVRKTTSTWDDIFLEKKVFTRLSHFAPALVIWTMAGWALKGFPLWMIFVHKLTYIYMVGAGMAVAISFIDAWHSIYNTLPISQHRPIKGYVQLVKIFIILVCTLIIVSVVFKKDITSILAGLSAMAAVLILVFKDTLLGLVASIQLSANKMLSVGEWITIPNKQVDGVVMDITLNTVKVQNFDKTIITLPTYSLVNEPFQNWSGMQESGVRQIKRQIYIDMRSIRFIDDKLKADLGKYPKLASYIEASEKNSPDSPFFNTQKLTNLGLFRYYSEEYLRNHPAIDPTQALIVRHRAPEGNGLPLQVFVFSKDNQFGPYENIQSEIFEHILAILKDFDLKVYQQPTGDDLLALRNL